MSSLLDNVIGSNLICIKLYYSINKSKKITILEDKQAEKLLANPEKAKMVEVLETFWQTLSWGSQKNLEIQCTDIDPESGNRNFNSVKFRDATIKNCLKKWNLTINEQPADVTSDLIDALPADIIYGLYIKFNEAISYKDADLGE
jgi:hypothetical protein